MDSPNLKEKRIHERKFSERLLSGQKAEDIIVQFIQSKFPNCEVFKRTGWDKRPDIEVSDKEDVLFEIEVKNTRKLKYQDFVFQLCYSYKQDVTVFILFIIFDEEKSQHKYKKVNIKSLLNYRENNNDYLYEDQNIGERYNRAYFIVDLEKIEGDWRYIPS